MQNRCRLRLESKIMPLEAMNLHAARCRVSEKKCPIAHSVLLTELFCMSFDREPLLLTDQNLAQVCDFFPKGSKTYARKGGNLLAGIKNSFKR